MLQSEVLHLANTLEHDIKFSDKSFADLACRVLTRWNAKIGEGMAFQLNYQSKRCVAAEEACSDVGAA
jgi:hypothetical protein